MSRIEILLNFIGRGTLIGIRCGCILAAVVYFVLTGFNLYAFSYLAYIFFALAIGLIFGGLVGGFNGLVLGIVTAFRFNKTIPRYYESVMITLSALATFIMSGLIYTTILAFYAYDNRVNFWVVLIGGLITSGIAIYGGHFVSKWYINKQQLPPAWALE